MPQGVILSLPFSPTILRRWCQSFHGFVCHSMLMTPLFVSLVLTSTLNSYFWLPIFILFGSLLNITNYYVSNWTLDFYYQSFSFLSWSHLVIWPHNTRICLESSLLLPILLHFTFNLLTKLSRSTSERYPGTKKVSWIPSLWPYPLLADSIPAYYNLFSE